MSSKRSRSGSLLGAIAGVLALSVIAGGLVAVGSAPVVAVAARGAGAAVQAFDDIPEFIEIGKLQQRNVLFANRGGKQVPFATLYSENRVTLPWDAVSQTLKDAAVAGEDRRFYEHGAVDLTSLARAAAGSIARRDFGAAGGGSTIAMQLVRNVLIAQADSIADPVQRTRALQQATEETPRRKIVEMKLAIGLEKKYSKDEILLAYLNIAYFGDHAYGVEAAAQHFFGKAAASLSAAEAASLIATVQYPETRNLSTPKNYPANAGRRDVILRSMLAEKKIDDTTYREAVAASIGSYVHLTPATQGCMAVSEKGAQQWCDLIRRQVTSLASLGATPEERQRNWRLGGYQVHTTLDLDLTAAAKEQVDTYAPNTETRYDLGGVVTSIEAKTGRVVVMAQNKDFDETAEGGDATTSAINYAVDRTLGGGTGFQPGSTYKPFTLLDWLQKGHRLNETVDATPRNFSPYTICGSTDRTAFAPKNDDGGNPGTVSARQATARSINTAFAAMAQKLDLCDIRDVAKSLGVHSADGAELVAYPSSIIGSGNTVAPLTMAAAFAGIANGGSYCAPVMIDDVVDAEGKTLAGQSQNCAQVLDPVVAAKAASALQGPFRSGTATSADPHDGTPILGKTGTTDRAEQTWLVGGSTNVVTASWVGNLTGHQNQYRISGPYGAMNQQRLTIWKNVQRRINAVYGGAAFATPPAERAPRRGSADTKHGIGTDSTDEAGAGRGTGPAPSGAPTPAP
jgi:membrane peptidoglycan carboxypeptidase